MHVKRNPPLVTINFRLTAFYVESVDLDLYNLESDKVKGIILSLRCSRVVDLCSATIYGSHMS